VYPQVRRGGDGEFSGGGVGVFYKCARVSDFGESYGDNFAVGVETISEVRFGDGCGILVPESDVDGAGVGVLPLQLVEFLLFSA